MDDLDQFTQDLLSAAVALENGKQAKKYLRTEGSKLRKETVEQVKAKVKKKTGKLIKSIKRGKPYERDGMNIRAYSGAPHAHLINNGHRIVDKNGKEHGFQEGVHFIENAEKEFQPEFHEDTEKWIDDMLDNHGL